jgi:hypothetical protein
MNEWMRRQEENRDGDEDEDENENENEWMNEKARRKRKKEKTLKKKTTRLCGAQTKTLILLTSRRYFWASLPSLLIHSLCVMYDFYFPPGLSHRRSVNRSFYIKIDRSIILYSRLPRQRLHKTVDRSWASYGLPTVDWLKELQTDSTMGSYCAKRTKRQVEFGLETATVSTDGWLACF